MKNIYIDITGLSYKHQSGVQNTLWGLVDGAEHYKGLTNNIFFYDCSGKINDTIFSRFGENYINELNSNNTNTSLLIKKLYDYGLLKLKFKPSSNSVNHVWNWGIKEIKGVDYNV